EGARGHGLVDLQAAIGDVGARPAEVVAVEGVGLGAAVELEDRALHGGAALLEIREAAVLPPRGRAREHAGRGGAHALPDLGQGAQGLLLGDEAHAAGARDAGDERGAVALDGAAAREGAEPVAEAAVDRALARPERGDRLAGGAR